MKLKTGKTYNAHQAAYSFEDIDGKTVEFDEVNFSFTVLEKPKTVVADDGIKQEVIKLPKHLAEAKWYWVRNETKNIHHWLNVEVYEISVEIDFIGWVLTNNSGSKVSLHCGEKIFSDLKNRAGIIVPCSEFKFKGRSYLKSNKCQDYEIRV
ncbi:hypothetical protein GCS60_000031 [Vibrio metschnikovii]|nr:hypothetical protein [Vibrio metschnikovii]